MSPSSRTFSDPQAGNSHVDLIVLRRRYDYATVISAAHELQALHLPMRRNLAEPGDAGVAEGDAGVEAAGDGTGDERPPLLRQQPQHALLRRHQPIQPRRLPVQVVGDGALAS